MLEDLENAADIAAATSRLLDKADARFRFPTPVDDLVEAAGLVESQSSPFSESLLATAPAHLLPVLRQVAGKVQGILDRRTREVHLHPRIEKDGHGRFLRTHEVSHDIFEWQRELLYAETGLTLSPATRNLFEREANQGSSELLFQREVFAQVASDYDIGFGAVTELSGKFGASLRATLRRFAETHRGQVAAVVLDREPVPGHPVKFRRNEAVASAAWRQRFGNPWSWPNELGTDRHEFVSVAAAGLGRTSWTGEAHVTDLVGEHPSVSVEVFDNHYGLLVLLWIPGKRRRLVRRRRVLTQSVG